MADDATQFEEKFRELQNLAPALSAWSYIAIWALSDMYQRAKTNPENPKFHEILFPHTKIPLFSEEEAKNLEELWRSKLLPMFEVGIQTEGQSGGAGIPTLGDVKKGSTFAGKAIGTAVAGIDPEAFSIDSHVESVNKLLDGIDAQVTDLSKKYGLVAIESTAPDPKFVIPLGPIAIPIIIPIKVIMPLVNLILEIFRLFASRIPYVGAVAVKPITIVMALLDLARGNFYHSMFTLLGLFGQYPLYLGILLKIARDAFVLISPNIRSDIRSVIYRSTKSFFVGFVMWAFATVAPEIIRKPIVMLLDKVRLIAENFNETMTKAEVQASAALKGFGSVELPKFPIERIPSISDLYILQEYIQNPRIYCHPDVSGLIQEMRSIPPLALFFDLLNVPSAGTQQFQQACANVAITPIIDEFKPKITFMNPATGLPIPDKPIPSVPGVVPGVSV